MSHRGTGSIASARDTRRRRLRAPYYASTVTPRPDRLPRLLLPAIIGTTVLIARAGDAHRTSAILLLLEPVAWVAGIWSIYAAFSIGRRRLAGSLMIAVIVSAILLRVVETGPIPPGQPPATLSRLKACARILPLPTAPIRLVQWHVSANEVQGIAEVVLGVHPDLVVLTGAPDDTVAEAVASGMGGGRVALQTPEGAALFFTRGVFQNCGDDDGWTHVPTSGSASAFVFAGVPPATTLPILLVQAPSPLSEPRYDSAAAAELSGAATFASELASSLLVVLADGPSASTARGLDRALRPSGLTNAANLPNWPTSLVGVPWPVPLHPFDRAWAASAWGRRESRLLRGADTQRHGVLTELSPSLALAPAP